MGAIKMFESVLMDAPKMFDLRIMDAFKMHDSTVMDAPRMLDLKTMDAFKMFEQMVSKSLTSSFNCFFFWTSNFRAFLSASLTSLWAFSNMDLISVSVSSNSEIVLQ